MTKKISPPASLSSHHLRTFEAIFRHPTSHNLAWRDVLALLRHVAEVTDEPNGNFRVTRNGQTLVLRPARTKDVSETSELVELRHFLERSEAPKPADQPGEIPWVVVIDHHEARIFPSETRGTVPMQIVPHDPEDFFRHAPHSKEFTRGREKPDPNSFFAPVVRALKDAREILIFGGGKGTGSEREQFTTWLKDHHPETAAKIVGSLVVDEHHLTDAQLLAHAREFSAHRESAAAFPA